MSAKNCPVCDWAIEGDGISVRIGDQTVTVCCAECAQKVKDDPTTYVRSG
jgi:ribosome-binding protein aMBF1 (putative translation factor)